MLKTIIADKTTLETELVEKKSELAMVNKIAKELRSIDEDMEKASDNPDKILDTIA